MKIRFLRNDVFHCRFSQVFCLSRTIDKRFRKMVISVCWLTAKYTLLLLTHFRKTKYADCLRGVFYCYLLSENCLDVSMLIVTPTHAQ